jgi:hypothetical protein
MSERTARTLGIVGIVLVILTIPVYFLDLLVVSPAVDHCPAEPGDNRSIVLWVFIAGVVMWAVGVVFSAIAITKPASRAYGIGGAVIALVVPLGALLGLYLLVGGDCFVPSGG